MPSVTLRNTKNVIYEAYQKAMTEVRNLKTQLRTSERALTKSQDAHKKALAQLKTADGRLKTSVKKVEPKVETVVKVVEKVATVDSVHGIIEVLSSIQEGIGTAISQCSGMQVIEAEQLADLQEKIAEHKTQIKSLYDIELADTTLDTLLETYEEEQETFDTTMEEKKEAYQADLEEKQKAWKKEQTENAVAVYDKTTADQQEQKREREEYDYKLKLERSIEDDNYSQKRKKLQEELDEIKEQKVEEFSQKEKAVKEKETEFTDYKKKHSELPELLRKAIKSAEHEGIAIIERDAKVKMNLLKKEVESSQKANDLKIKSLQGTIAKQEIQIVKLSGQLEKALQQAQSLALKAIEGSANAESFSAIKAIAMEQAKNVNKSK